MKNRKTFVTVDPEKDMDELANTLLNLRHHTKLWSEHYGAIHRENKKRWEERADTWLANHLKPETNDTDQ